MQVMSAVNPMQAAGHNKPHGTGSIAARPCKERKDGAPTFRNGKENTESRATRPDPAGAGWNQYAYPTNPNSEIDPLRLDPKCLTNPNTGTCFRQNWNGADPSAGCLNLDGGGACAGLIGSAFDWQGIPYVPADARWVPETLSPETVNDWVYPLNGDGTVVSCGRIYQRQHHQLDRFGRILDQSRDFPDV